MGVELFQEIRRRFELRPFVFTDLLRLSLFDEFVIAPPFGLRRLISSSNSDSVTLRQRPDAVWVSKRSRGPLSSRRGLSCKRPGKKEQEATEKTEKTQTPFPPLPPVQFPPAPLI